MKNYSSYIPQILSLKSAKRNLLITFSLLFCLHVSAQRINTLTKSEKNDGWKMLFNGNNLSGWRTFNGGEVSGWKVRKGILYNSGTGSDHGGDIIADNEYDNFELYLEWNILSL